MPSSPPRARRGASAALVSRDVADGPALLTVANTQRGLEDMGRAARARSFAKIVGVTGSAGKTTTKEISSWWLGALGRTHASSGSYNNQWGVAAVAGADAARCAIRHLRNRHEPFRRDPRAGRLVRPHVALVTTIAPAHLEFFGTCEAIADAKSEIFEGLAPGGRRAAAVGFALRGTPEGARAPAGVHAPSRPSAKKAGSDARLLSLGDHGEGSKVEGRYPRRPVHFHLGAPGAHIARNALARCWRCRARRRRAERGGGAFAILGAQGRGARVALAGGNRADDESYNANPARWRRRWRCWVQPRPGAASPCSATCWRWVRTAPRTMPRWARDIAAARADLVFLNGEAMRALWDALPASRRGAWAPTSAENAPHVTAALGKRATPSGEGFAGKQDGRDRRCAEGAWRQGLGGGSRASVSAGFARVAVFGAERRPLHHLSARAARS